MKKRNTRNFIYLLKFIKLLYCENKKLVFGLFLTVILVSLFTTITVYLNKVLVDGLSRNISSTGIIKCILIIVLCIAFMRFGTNILNETITYLKVKLSERVGFQLQEKVQLKIAKVERAAFENAELLDLIERIKGTMSSNSTTLLESLTVIIRSMITIAIYAVMFATLKWYFPIIVLCCYFLNFIINMKYGLSTYFLKKKQSRVVRKSNYLEKLLTKREYAKEIRSFNLMNYLIDRLMKIRKEVLKEEAKLVTTFTITSLITKLLQYAGYAICALIVGIEIFHGMASIGDFVLIFSIGMNFGVELDIMMNKISSINKFLVQMNDYGEFEEIPEEQGGHEVINDMVEIQFNNIEFTYPNNLQPTIQSVSGCIPKGKITVLVGENGSGKTTFLNLIMGLYLSQKGSILVNGLEMERVRFSLRDITAYVFQNFNKYQMTIRENLFPNFCINENDSEFSNIRELVDFIDDMPMGLDTPLGQFDEGGVELSGGQWQRIAFARALLKPESKLLVFDEPTASLDPIIESQIYENLIRYIRGRTTIIVSHRLSVCSFADEIIVFDHGKIIERGSHEDLFNAKGLYYKMYQSQSSLYKY